MGQAGGIAITEACRFLTLMALKVFADRNVDAAVVEVGLGGRLDDTNIFAAPVATAVTILDYDHTAILGDTLTDIAYQKAGIFRANVPAFTCPQADEAQAELQRNADEVCVLDTVQCCCCPWVAR
jgi:folylpolyglutamate synthase